MGKVLAGAVTFEPKENPQGDYFIVTKAYTLYLNFLQWENAEQKLTIEKLRAIIEGKKGPLQ